MIVQIHGFDAVPIDNCPLGHTTQPASLWQKDDFEYRRCPDCGVVWVSPQLTDGAVEQIYTIGFASKAAHHERPASFLAYRPLLKKIRPYRQFNRLLDVGCFTGNFLLAAREDGWQQPEGTEISPPAVTFAREEYGLTIHQGDLTTLTLPEAAYDVVTLQDVIEHVSDPMATIEATYKLLRPGGVLYMDTPHFTSVPQKLYGKDWSVFFPWHRTYFSVDNMRYALEKAGFQVTFIAAVGLLPFTRGNPFEGIRSRQTRPAVSTANPAPAKKPSFLKRYKNQLRPIWLAVKRGHYIPFYLLSRVGIHIGAKLIVYAEKPADR